MRNLFYVPLLLLPVQSMLAQEVRPNVIVFLVDDMGLMDTSLPFLTDDKGNSVRYPLNDWYRTPNMERMARQGIRFSTFYAQSVSSPSRASIMTGQNAARHRTTNWIQSESNNSTRVRTASVQRTFSVCKGVSGCILPEALLSFINILRNMQSSLFQWSFKIHALKHICKSVV